MISGNLLSMCRHSFGKSCQDREPLELVDRVFLVSGKKEKEGGFFHVVSPSLVFSLGLVRGPPVMCHRAIPAISRLLYPAGKRWVKGEVNQMHSLVSFNSYFGLIVGLTPKPSVGVWGYA